MPEYPVEPDADGPSLESGQVWLNNVPEQGSWFDMGDGTPAQLKEVRIIGGEKVIFARLGNDDDRRRLKSDGR